MTFRKKYKDSVFTDLFGSDRDGKLIVLVEHQSTVNENMPFRCLEYVTRIYEGIVPVRKRYAEKVYKIPKCCRLLETVIF